MTEALLFALSRLVALWWPFISFVVPPIAMLCNETWSTIGALDGD